ncbi:GlsB/YeaQ/YmgE family stress response membrane protein [Elizabethkingia argentiflava]|uniref:GlsB/YeaQ/YmgE family stress response membrane protein n=1 Tax=Elizabethkingia argenteiflava TaxID=2681556 RepID=A0A845Q018_9FLAO|nr:GlsB/YeaQ/YmgE family stress response membrane protein [Elizabethkingia argenteiflava]NAW51958.1 GlsB/YeaQ/YmgE family stress response membrane protein [Elizabethkingia argenteiflava]
MNWITFIVFGLIAGVIAKAIHPGKDVGGWLITIFLGILGSIVGRWLAGLLGWYAPDSFWSFKNWIFSIGGAVLLLFIYGRIRSK